MRKLFNVLSVIFVVIGFLALISGESTIGMFFIALGMIGIGIAAYNRR